MLIHVKWQKGGDAASIELEGTDTLEMVRGKIAAACRVHPQLQQIVYKGKMLRESDNKTVSEYGITKEEDLRLSSRREPIPVRLNVGGTIYTTLLSTLRKVQINAAQRRDPRTYRRGKIVGGLRFADDVAQDFTRLLFHRTAMLGRTDAKAPLHVIVQVPDGNACHDILLRGV